MSVFTENPCPVCSSCEKYVLIEAIRFNLNAPFRQTTRPRSDQLSFVVPKQPPARKTHQIAQNVRPGQRWSLQLYLGNRWRQPDRVRRRVYSKRQLHHQWWIGGKWTGRIAFNLLEVRPKLLAIEKWLESEEFTRRLEIGIETMVFCVDLFWSRSSTLRTYIWIHCYAAATTGCCWLVLLYKESMDVLQEPRCLHHTSTLTTTIQKHQQPHHGWWCKTHIAHQTKLWLGE